MLCWSVRVTIVLGVFLAMLAPQRPVWGAEVQSPADEVRRRLKAQDEWLGSGTNAKNWEQFLMVDTLREQLAAKQADPDTLSEILARYTSDVNGLDNPRFVGVRRALTAWLDTFPEEPLDELAKTIGENNDLFVPTKPEDVERARKNLAAAIKRLDDYLTPGGDNGARWKKFLEWDDLNAQAARDGKPDPAVLARLERLFQSGYPGLEMKVFRDVGDAIGAFSDVVSSLRVADQQAEFDSSRKVFRERLENFLKEPTGDRYDDLAEAVGFFQRRGHARIYLARVRRHFNQPNLVVRVSEKMVSEAMSEPVNETTPVVDNILGTSITGTGHTTGEVHIDLATDDDFARLKTVFDGHVNSRTVGVNGPAVIQTAGLTTFAAHQDIFLDATGLTTVGPHAQATLCTQTLCVGSNKRIGGRIVRRVATKRVAQSKWESEQIGAQHAEVRIEERMNERVEKRVAEANATFRERFRNTLKRRHAYPTAVDFHTTDEALWVEWLQRGPGELAAPSAPPKLVDDSDLSARVHESLLNHLTSDTLAGLKLDDVELRRLLKDVYGEVPRQFEREEDEAPWSITFARRRPVTVRFDNDTLSVTIRGSRYTSGENAYEAMNVSTSYRVERDGDKMALVRQGEIEVLPPDFKPGQTLSLKQTTLRRLLTRRFNKIFEPRYDLDQLALTGNLAAAGKLAVQEFDVKGGWLATSWKLVPAPAALQTAEAEQNRRD